MIWIILISALAWSTIKSEPPPNSYLPPATGPAQSPSSQYNTPGSGRQSPGRQSSPSGRIDDSYLPPNSANPSNGITPEYGPPNQRGSPGSQRGGPQRGFNQQRPGQSNEPQCGGSNGPCSQPSSQYGVPASGRQPGSQSFGNGNRPSGNGLQSTYGPPNRGQGGPGSLGGSDYPQSPDTSYGAPNAGFPSQGSGFPGQSQRPGSNADRGFSRDSPSSSYGAPNAGRPGGRSSGYQQSGGDDSDEPAKYEFSYDVDDAQTGTKFGHSEQRDGDSATGEYNVVLPDGRKQVVEYEAGLDGYKPQIRYEGSGGGAGFGFGGGAGGGAGSGGYSEGRPGSDSLGGGYPQNGQNGPQGGKYQQSGDFNQGQSSGYPDSSQGEGYPSGGPSNGFSRGQSQGGNGNYPNGGSSSGGYPSGSQGDGGYPRGGPGSDSGPGQGRNGNYPTGGPQGGRNGQNRGRNGGSGSGFDDNNGYPSGGPNGPRGSGY